MELSELLRPELVEVDFAARTPEEAIEALIRLLVARGELPAALEEAARRAVLEHERRRSTGMAHGVALPHGALDGPEEILCALGIAREGIRWPALDGGPVDLVLLLVVPANRLQVHVRVLAGIARLLNDRHLRERLRAARNAEQAYAAICAAEGREEPSLSSPSGEGAAAG
ncbi:MAG: PTS fructose transporter subunit IIA [Planctomycetota bacterium]|nr:MAG: PTS fructose transporter subunit IIA [Planctomycetota bacterium]